MLKRTKANLCPLCRKGHLMKYHGWWGSERMQCTRRPKCKYSKELK